MNDKAVYVTTGFLIWTVCSNCTELEFVDEGTDLVSAPIHESKSVQKVENTKKSFCGETSRVIQSSYVKLREYQLIGQIAKSTVGDVKKDQNLQTQSIVVSSEIHAIRAVAIWGENRSPFNVAQKSQLWSIMKDVLFGSQ